MVSTGLMTGMMVVLSIAGASESPQKNSKLYRKTPSTPAPAARPTSRPDVACWAGTKRSAMSRTTAPPPNRSSAAHGVRQMVDDHLGTAEAAAP